MNNLSHLLKYKDGKLNIESMSNGFYVSISNDSSQPMIKYEGIEISPGHVTNIGITRTFYEKLPSPYSECRPNPLEPALSTDSYYYKLTVDMGIYKQNQCFEICFQYSYAIPVCNCSDPSVNSNVNRVRVCSFGIDQQCLNIQRSEFSSANCLADCPDVCDRPSYMYEASVSKYPSQ